MENPANSDLERDAGLEKWMRRGGDGVPLGTVDWSGLHGRIMERAVRALERRRGGEVYWWTFVARWAPALAPLALAACAVLAIALGMSRGAVEGALLEDAMADVRDSQGLEQLLLVDWADADLLLWATVEPEGEGR
ncbi:MAG: hypothetical protein HYV63_04975 [Candidatus Schekmanbacteria bacterium]|nr:hypothetical protein [Candidatus Schekmanbacteria bacterium]